MGLFREQWGQNCSRQDSLNLNNGIIDDLLALNTQVANASNLTMDTNLDSYYLVDTALNKLPFELEKSAQLTIAGVDVASSKSTDTGDQNATGPDIGRLEELPGFPAERPAGGLPAKSGAKTEAGHRLIVTQVSSTMQFLNSVNSDLVERRLSPSSRRISTTSGWHP